MSDHTLNNHLFVRSRRSQGKLPANQFGELVGVFDHATTVPEGKTRPDDNHVYLWIRVKSGQNTGAYECAFNIHSTDTSEVQYTDLLEDLTGKPMPVIGFKNTSLSYHQLGVTGADFKPIKNGDLQSLVTHYAQTCTEMAAFGHTYSDGTGLHDIHLNSGEPAGSGHPNLHNQDGALVFYFHGNPQDNPHPYARWVLVKFATQTL